MKLSLFTFALSIIFTSNAVIVKNNTNHYIIIHNLEFRDGREKNWWYNVSMEKYIINSQEIWTKEGLNSFFITAANGAFVQKFDDLMDRLIITFNKEGEIEYTFFLRNQDILIQNIYRNIYI